MSSLKKLVYCFDIDGTLCSQTSGDYENAIPLQDRIELVNRLAAQGHEIKLFTARGANSGIDWSDFTSAQVRDWGIVHHSLLFGKPHADYFIDDKGMHSEIFFDGVTISFDNL